MEKKRLDLEKRSIISGELDHNESFAEIGRKIDAAGSTVSREVKSHLVVRRTGGHGLPFNECIHRFGCNKTGICSDCTVNRKCRTCNRICCNLCPEFEAQKCQRLVKPPYVCNGCEQRGTCTLEKKYYFPVEAQKEYDAVWSESHTGISLTEEECSRIDSIVSPLICRGQSLEHIMAVHEAEIMVSKSTVYRLLDSGILHAKNLDLPKRVRFGKRKKTEKLKVDKKCRIDRTYQDFLDFMEQNGNPMFVELDSVEGRKGGKVLLTIHFVYPRMMLGYLRSANTSASVTECFDRIYRKIGHEAFQKLFPVCLADNGSEFSDPMKIEYDWSGTSEARTRVFYCNPSSPFQKGAGERNHEYIRLVLPKGTSLDDYTQEDIDLLMDHVNSHIRPGLGNKSPYDMFECIYGAEMLEKLGLHKIPADEVHLKPDLLKSRQKNNESD